MSETIRTHCTWCGSAVQPKDFCQTCIAEFPNRPKPETMTPDERVAEMKTIGKIAEVPFRLFHGRVEQLVGRPVWTHEIGLNWKGLIQESRWEGRPATMDEIIELIPEEKRIIVSLAE